MCPERWRGLIPGEGAGLRSKSCVYRPRRRPWTYVRFLKGETEKTFICDQWALWLSDSYPFCILSSCPVETPVKKLVDQLWGSIMDGGDRVLALDFGAEAVQSVSQSSNVSWQILRFEYLLIPMVLGLDNCTFPSFRHIPSTHRLVPVLLRRTTVAVN